MARRYWSINIPRFKAGTLIELAEIIYSRHKDDGEESILSVFDMEKFDQDAKESEILRKKALSPQTRILIHLDSGDISISTVRMPVVFSIIATSVMVVQVTEMFTSIILIQM